MNPLRRPVQTNRKLSDANKSWICSLTALVLASLVFRQNLWPELMAVLLSGLVAWFGWRAVKLGPMKPLGAVMLVLNLLMFVGGLYSRLAD